MRKRLFLAVTLLMVYLTAAAMPMHVDAACVNPPSGMVSWWGGDNNALDIVGTNNGTLNGATYAPGLIGQAFSFDGVDDYLEVPNSATLDLTGGLTMSAWVYLRASGASTIFSKADYNGSQSVTSYGLQVNADGAINAALYGTYPADNWTTAAGLITPNNWYHIALTWDGTYGPSDNVRLYINGSFVQAWTKSPTPLNTTSQTLTLGSMKPGTYYGSMDGLIDEAALFSRALSAAEIAAIYNAGSAGMCRPCAPPPLDMVSWWSGDNNARDVLGNNSGTPVNGATYGVGKVGRAFRFDGENDYVSVPDSPSLDITGSISMDAWIYRNDGTSEAGLLKKGDFGSNGVYSLAIYNNKFYFRLNGDNLNLPSVTDIPVGTWTHVAGTYDGTTARIYINGILDTSASYSASIGTDNNPLYIGLYGATTKYFPGLIDELEIFDRTLSADEIAAIYNAGSAGKCTPQCTPPPSGTVSWWGGDNNALDLVGTNNGTLNGATYAPGKVGQAFSFDGTNDHVEMPAGAFEFGGNAFTIDFWMYSDTIGTGTGGTYILGKSNPDGSGGFDVRLENSAIRVVGVNGWGFNITSDASATPNAWHHVALSATGSTVDLYIDGALKGSSERKPISTTSNPFRIGFTTNFDGTAYSGLIDEVHIISRALTAEEIADIYNAVSAGMCRSSSPLPAGLAAWWKAENNANDQLGVNNGTLNGATFSSGKVGQAFSLDGEDDFISIPDGIVASTARNFTVGAWVYANTVNASGENHIVYSGRSGGGEYYLANRNGNFEFAVYLSGSGWLRIGVTADIGVWRYVTGVRRGTAIEIWVDGMLRNSMTIPDSDLVTGAAVHSSIGSYNRGQYGFWDGLIDEASIFNRALSADEIASIYNAGGSGMFTPDTTPDAFSFTSQAGVPRNTSIVSNPITVTGINSPADISIVDGEYSISTDNGVNWTPFSSSTPSTVGLNNQVKVRRTSAATNNSTVTAALTIGGVSEDFYVTTLISTPVSDDITGNTIWRAANSPYYVTGLIVVNSGVTLTIEPGTVVKFGQGINITGINVSGNLVANGASGTIFFTDSRDGTTPDGMTIGGSTPLAGSWYGIQVLAGGSATMDHCEVRYGGNSGSYQANVGKHGGGSLSLTNSIIRNSACYGVRIFDASGGHTVSGNIISNSGNSGIYLSNIGSGATISGNTISNNPSYGIDLDNGSPVISGNTISASAYGIRSHNASPSITSNSSTGNSKYGLYLTGVANPSAITGNTLTGNTTGGVGMTAEASGAVVADSNIFSGPLHIEVGSIVSAVSWSSNRVYYVVGLIAVNAGVTLTIEPGTVVKFAQGIDTTGINVTGNLVANGASGTIFFTDSRDGTTPDGMTIGSSTPSAGSWYGIQVLDGGSATIDHCEVRFGGNDGGYQANVAKHGGGSLRLTNSIIRNSAYYGVRIFASGGGHTVSGNTIGNSGNSGIYLENSGNGVTISGNSISGNTSKGLHLSGAGTTPLVKNNRIFSNSIGILCDASASPVIGGSAENGNDIYNNTFGVQNASANTVTATDNWWGSATGPIHSTNPNGTGNAVSENVNFIPFQTTSFHTFDLTIAFAGSGNGTVNVTPGGGSGNSGWTTPIHVGDSITLTADPAPDAVFGGWSGGGCSGTGTCSFTMDGDVTITATFNGMAPVADFTGTPLSGVEPLIVSFTDTTTFAPYSWLWNFGDSSGSFAKNPVHAYLDPGTFNVSLAATNAYGSDTETKTGFVTVTACPHGPASILPDFYDSLQEAYGNSANGSMIRARYKVLGETLNINRENTTVYIYGGYDCDHQNQLGVTTIGTLTVSKGTTFVRDIVIK